MPVSIFHEHSRNAYTIAQSHFKLTQIIRIVYNEELATFTADLMPQHLRGFFLQIFDYFVRIHITKMRESIADRKDTLTRFQALVFFDTLRHVFEEQIQVRF